jgi:protein-S-isoprenylcysteine O-methyltransferase Ste14
LPPPHPQTGEKGSSRWLLAGYLGLTGFLALEGLVREGGSASSLKATSDDRGSTLLIGATYSLVALAPVLLRRGRGVLIPCLPRATGPIGLLVELTGLGMRAWSMRTLRTSYSRTLRTEAGQQVMDTGPYRRIRHPGYLGSLLTWTGFSLTSQSAPVVGTMAGLLVVYRYRILAEEEMLVRQLAGYSGYVERTKRLIPFVW